MKRIALIAAAALVVLSIASVASASASTVLCKSYGTGLCPSADIEPAGSWLTFGAPKGEGRLVLKHIGSFGSDLNCGGFLIGNKTTVESATGSLPAISEFYLNECSQPAGALSHSCTATATGPNAAIIATSESREGNIRYGTVLNGGATITYTCYWGEKGETPITCKYKDKNFTTVHDIPNVTGAPEFTANEEMSLVEGSATFCSNTTATLELEGWLAVESLIARA